MKRLAVIQAILVTFFITGIGYFIACTHDDVVLPSNGPNIVRGSTQYSLTSAGNAFDKVHSNINWQTAYLGSTALVTGRFNSFGVDNFEFTENDASKISFKAWVWLNTVNTGEPGRDAGCLLGTFGTAIGKTTEAENMAIITSTNVQLSTNDKGYVVTADLTFHGVTKSVTGKLFYIGQAEETLFGVTYDVYGFSLSFPFLALTDFGITATNIADNVDVVCNVQFTHAH